MGTGLLYIWLLRCKAVFSNAFLPTKVIMHGLLSIIILQQFCFAKALKEKLGFNIESKNQLTQIQSQLVAIVKDYNGFPISFMNITMEELVLDTIEEK